MSTAQEPPEPVDRPHDRPDEQPNDGQAAQKRAIAFLTMDIQRTREAAIELAEKLAAVRSGELAGWERLGNAYCLNLHPDRATIEDTIDDQSATCTLSIDDFAQLVQDWIASLESDSPLD
jgi:hypothetical protein